MPKPTAIFEAPPNLPSGENYYIFVSGSYATTEQLTASVSAFTNHGELSIGTDGDQGAFAITDTTPGTTPGANFLTGKICVPADAGPVSIYVEVQDQDGVFAEVEASEQQTLPNTELTYMVIGTDDGGGPKTFNVVLMLYASGTSTGNPGSCPAPFGQTSPTG